MYYPIAFSTDMAAVTMMTRGRASAAGAMATGAIALEPVQASKTAVPDASRDDITPAETPRQDDASQKADSLNVEDDRIALEPRDATLQVLRVSKVRGIVVISTLAGV